MSSDFQQQIQESTLRLKCKNDYGTGFFIAPGLVLTCNHIVKNPDNAGRKIEAVWSGKEFYLDVINAFENPDIALLSIEVIDHPCVFLDKQDASIGHTLYGYGYPERDKDGSCISPIVEGLSDKGRLLTLKDANVRDGFSGSPLLNLETKKVCGMIVIRRDRRHPSQSSQQILEPIGGQAIPSEVIMTKWPELSSSSSVVKSIFNIQAISQLGLFMDHFDQDLTTINPWEIHRQVSLPQKDDLKNLLLTWARKLHFSFLNLEISEVECLLRKLASSTVNCQEEDMYKYFLAPQADMRLKILRSFCRRYRRKAPFADCVYMFLFLSTHNYSFLETIDAELIKQQFREFAENSIADSISHLFR
jgi:hypothetical protein